MRKNVTFVSAALAAALVLVGFFFWRSILREKQWHAEVTGLAVFYGSRRASEDFVSGKRRMYVIDGEQQGEQFTGKTDGVCEIWSVQYSPFLGSVHTFSKEQQLESYNLRMKYLTSHPEEFPKEKVQSSIVAANGNSWSRYESDFGKYSALFPAQPSEVIEEKQNSRTYSASTPNYELSMMVTCAGDRNAEAPLRDLLDAVCKRLNAREVTIAETEMYGHRGLDASFESESAGTIKRYRWRMLFSRGAFYQLVTIDHTGRANQSDIDRFFTSFQFNREEVPKD